FEIVYGFLTSMDLGDVHIDKIPVYIRHFYDEANPVDGYLGKAALGQLLTAVDYGAKRLVLVRQRNSSATSLSAVSVSTNKQQDSTAIEARPGVDMPVRSTS